MAIHTTESVCALCQERLPAAEPIFAARGVFPVPAGLQRFCDAPMHWNCYAQWPHRRAFAAAYVQMWVVVAALNSSWSLVWLDEHMLVTVQAEAYGAEVSVLLQQTGSELRVKLADWETWLAAQADCPSGRHPIETAAVAAAVPILRAHLPTEETIVNQVDGAAG